MDKIIFKKEYKEPRHRYNILSVCLFIMKKSYKTNNVYVEGLEYTLRNFEKVLPNFYLRIYYDSSIELDERLINLLKEARQIPKVQLVKFEHPWFKNEHGHHLGTFGTLVRLFPLFGNKEPNVKIVLVVDIDYNNDIFPYWKNTYKIFKKSSSQVHMYAKDCAHLEERVQSIVKSLNLNISPFLFSFWSKLRFSVKLLDTFLKCLHDGKDIDTTIGCKVVDIFVQKVDYDKVKQANKMEKQKIMYGIDEVCMLMLIKHIIDKKIPYSYHIHPDILAPFRYAYAIDNTLVNSHEHKALIKRMMQKYYDNKKSPSHNYYKMYSVINTYDFMSSMNKEIMRLKRYYSKNIRNIYETILVRDYEKYKLNKDIVMCIHDNKITEMTLVNIKH